MRIRRVAWRGIRERGQGQGEKGERGEKTDTWHLLSILIPFLYCLFVLSLVSLALVLLSCLCSCPPVLFWYGVYAFSVVSLFLFPGWYLIHSVVQYRRIVSVWILWKVPMNFLLIIFLLLEMKYFLLHLLQRKWLKPVCLLLPRKVRKRRTEEWGGTWKEVIHKESNYTFIYDTSES